MSLFHWTLIKRCWISISISGILLILIPIWTIYCAPSFKEISGNFTYTAEILSLDNFYDEAAKKFQGQHISKTTFSYHIAAKNPDYYTILNQFTVLTLSDKPIISISRLYFINPQSWKHVYVPNHEARTGYLFGPRYADKTDFNYWHVNYDAPATLKFVNKEIIEGLTVYHYQAFYSSDQTANLAYLPGVPEKRGVKTNINLQLWIEPISGWLVKYIDKTQAYYYDKNTGLKIAPWNNFSNRYTQNSVRNQVHIATLMKWKYLFVDFGVPIILATLAIMFLVFGVGPNGNKYFTLTYYWKSLLKFNKIVFPYYVGALLVMLSGISIYYLFLRTKIPIIYTIGISQWSNNADLIEIIRGFKDGLKEYGYSEGKNVSYIVKNANSNIEEQINIIQSFIDNQANIIFTLSTPGTLVAKGMTDNTPIVFADVIYPEESDIIDSSQSSNNNLVGIRNYISPAQQFNAFEKIYPNTTTMGFIHHKGDPDSEIQYQEFKLLLNPRNIQVVDIPAIDLEDLNRQLERKDINYNVLYTACDTLIQDKGGELVADFSKKNKLPNFSCDKESILNGALMGVVADPYTMGLLAGKKSALILRGAEPAWLSTEAPHSGYLIINLSAAKAIGIAIPQTMLSHANYIVEGKPK